MRAARGTARIEARLRAAQNDPVLVAAALALQRHDLPAAERLLKDRLRQDQDDIAALRMLAELAARIGRPDDAIGLLEHTLQIAPTFAAARLNYATLLHRRNRLVEARAEIGRVLAAMPRDPGALGLKAAITARLGDYDGAIAIYQDVLRRFPHQPRLWMSLGHAFKTVGRRSDSIAAYRRAIEIAPGLGEAWWSLANLKTLRFTDADVTSMQAALSAAGATPADRYHLHFALGKALEDARAYDAAFGHYAAGARLRRAELPYDSREMTRHVDRSRRLLTRAVFDARHGQGCDDPAPIFIVGLPRAGSTLIEQILASHSRIEGTMELPDLGVLARELAGERGGTADAANESLGYLEPLLALDAEGLASLGRRYIERTRVQRKTDRPFFIDKMPNNFAHVGLIQMILPRARIIDARRHPMANCFSAFKQHFSRGQGFSYDLRELGLYYRDYAALMAHFDHELPGRVYRMTYETLIANPEEQIRAVLAYCGLDFETNCLRFHQTDRPVRTASSEQVRTPITDQNVNQWMNFRQYLHDLEAILFNTE